MSTPPNPAFAIKATYLGPIFSIDGELSKNAQNLVFARNGTGKSFLSRAFRYLDWQGQDKDVSEAAFTLVSDESPDAKGSFSFSRGTNVLGALQLEKPGDKVTANVADTIFHVFSEDFVHEELRDRQYEIDGEIENQIAVDSANIELKDTQEALQKAREAEQQAGSALRTKHDTAKIQDLVDKAGINKNLSEYKRLNLESLLERFPDKPDAPKQSFAGILSDLDSLRAIPAEPVYPGTVDAVGSDDIDLDALEASLQKVTSPSSVSDEIKKKIDAHHSFYETGIQLVQEEHRTTCPFCEQGITAPDPKAIIDAYVSYFADEEEKHKRELRDYSRKLKQNEARLKDIETQLTRQKLRFDDLKHHVPSKKDVEVADGETALKDARTAISALKTSLEQKTQALASAHSLSTDNLAVHIAALKGIIEDNNTKVAELTKAVEKADDERKALQRKACTVFEQEFALNSWSDIEALRNLNKATQAKQKELSELEKAAPSTNAKERVAETFALLLKEFFADKYVFDRENFILKRGDKEMERGPHRTLSDGEKTAIAFCYFVACIHRKVASDSDYRKLFLVFDDPVTSMSYDFVFSIAQTLKNLSISDQGEVSINPAKIDGNKNKRPNLLVLTHSSYFFNISRTNSVIKKDATFSIYKDGITHKLIHLHSYVAPFEQQLEHVYQVANGDNPDHSTGNAIRQVLEAVGRFCRPDKSHDLQNFISFLAGDEGFKIKSVLINSLSHGTYYDETPSPEDLKLACEEAIAVVEHFAIGQINLIKT
ncbi:AAA family ATPase [Sneathiella limimaris]|uniref:AAA family ATPase n=1 Tax=Sneathiella limimaris TaxID=1964213 RepID=UPI00146A0ADD|nr:AAA family ATPase [Sneathiella limimaris]